MGKTSPPLGPQRQGKSYRTTGCWENLNATLVGSKRGILDGERRPERGERKETESKAFRLLIRIPGKGGQSKGSTGDLGTLKTDEGSKCLAAWYNCSTYSRGHGGQSGKSRRQTVYAQSKNPGGP